ncbi:hypothetical protein E4T56_gene2661 [Termitomyces sp. T112]|nr:hypothetical protein E4T56_gene2661 [Termitomyces sp. T112]
MLPQYLIRSVWNALLTEFFSAKDDWIVHPQVGDSNQHLAVASHHQIPPSVRSEEYIDFGVYLVVENVEAKIPGMFVELKSFRSLDSLQARADADTQMRKRAFGHMVCKYELRKDKKNELTSLPLPNSHRYVVTSRLRIVGI